jgi:hypothetical protein
MSLQVIFQLVSGSLAAILVTTFILWKFRFVIWKGWFRAIIECEDEDVIIRTIRLKSSKKNPTASEQDECIWLTVKGVRDRYDIIPDRVRRMGKFRIPTAFYYAHRSEPIDLKALKIESKISATRNAELARNTVTSQLLTAFTESGLREAMVIFLGVIVILGGILILGYWVNTKFEELAGLL